MPDAIPYNYGKYIDDQMKIKDTGTISAGEQINSPSSAGSRGLAQTTQFTNDKTQMQLGQEAIAESMVEIRSILNRIDGVNAPVQEDAGEDEKVVDMLRKIKQHLDNHPNMNEHPSLVALDQLADDLESGDKPADYESAVPEDAEDDRIEKAMKDMQPSNVTGYYDITDFWKEHTQMWGKTDDEVMHMIYEWTWDEIGYSGSQERDELAKRTSAIVVDALKNNKDDMTFDDMIDQLKSKGETAVEEDAGELARLKELSGMEAPKESEETVSEDIDERGRIALEKAGFDPMKVKEYMAVFNDHGDTSEIDQMNMDKVGLADAMAMVLASHDVENESYQPMPEGDEFDIEEDEDFEEVLGPLGFPEDETELFDAEYQGRKVPLNKPMRGDVKKFKVYVKDPKSGNVKKVNFGHGGTSAKRPTMRIRKSNPKARKSFRARHNCANPGPKTKARYWSCRKW